MCKSNSDNSKDEALSLFGDQSKFTREECNTYHNVLSDNSEACFTPVGFTKDYGRTDVVKSTDSLYEKLRRADAALKKESSSLDMEELNDKEVI